jgi:hypothetical protein
MKLKNAIFLAGTFILFFSFESVCPAKEKIIIHRKTQSVEFDESTVDGQARHPDAAYLVQKRSVDFVPLYKIREHFDENIRSSIDYLK